MCIRDSLKVYTGPDSAMSINEADVLAVRISGIERIGTILQALEAAGLMLRGGGKWTVTTGSTVREAGSVYALGEAVQAGAQSGIDIQRYKGLGEMNADQLWDSTMDPEKRVLYKVTMDDVLEADEIFTILMSDGVEARRDYIEKYALEITNLDV